MKMQTARKYKKMQIRMQISLLSFFLLSVGFAQSVQALNTPPPDSKTNEADVKRLYDPNRQDPVPVQISIDKSGNAVERNENYPAFTDAYPLEKSYRDEVASGKVKAFSRDLYLEGETGTPSDGMFAKHYKDYCSGNAVDQTLNKGPCQSDPVLQNADLSIGSVLGTSGYNTQANKDAAIEFAKNLINPFPDPAYLTPDKKINFSQLADSPAGRKALAKALSEVAILSPARETILGMIANRTRIPLSKGPTSKMEVMEKEAIGRFLNQAWIKKMEYRRDDAIRRKSYEEAATYEIVIILAFQSWMEFERYKQADMTNALLSSLVSLQYRQAKALEATVTVPAGTQTAAGG